MKNYFHDVLSQFKWYRISLGGKWYNVVVPEPGGIEGSVAYWTREAEAGVKILKEENY